MPKQEIPDWVHETLPEHIYKLVLFENGDSGAEEVDLTRDEYIALKAHLATMRGYQMPTIEDAVDQIQKTEELHQYVEYARHLETARDFYKSLPHLVVMQSEEFDKQLANAAAVDQ